MNHEANGRILLVDDDAVFNQVLGRALSTRGFEVRGAHNGKEALALCAEFKPRYIVLDLKLGTESGLGLIPSFNREVPDARILLLTGYASIATAVEAIKLGADDYLPKPATVQMILRALGEEDEGGEEPEDVEPPDAMTPISRLQWEHIQQALHETGGNVSAAARLLGMHRRSLQRKLQKFAPQ